MRTLCITAIIFFSSFIAYKYPRIIAERAKEENETPSLGMWLIFVLAVGLSFITMIVRSVQSSWSFEGIVYNAADVLMVSSILCSLMKRAGGKIILESYELFYILGVFGICIFWVSSGGTYNTNILSQILISLGYAPTIHKMKEKKRNTESLLI